MTWFKKLRGANGGYVAFNGVDVDSNNNAVVVGQGPAASGDANAIVVKYDQNGTIVWQNTFGDNNYESGFGIAVNRSNDRIYFVGSMFPGINRGVLTALAPTGELYWSVSAGQGTYSKLYGVAVDSTTGNIYTSGDYNNGSIVIGWDENGTPLWQNRINNYYLWYFYGTRSINFNATSIALVGYTYDNNINNSEAASPRTEERYRNRLVRC